MTRVYIRDPFETWERWFAWYPAYIPQKTGGWIRVWWETVERRRAMHGHDPVWEYRNAERVQ